MKIPGTGGFLLSLVFFFFPAIPMVAQLPADESVFYKKAVDNLVGIYHQSSGHQSRLYNGSQYAGYPFKFKEGHPFFKTEVPGRGSVVYDDILYENVMMQYDEVQEAVFIERNSRRIQLLNPRVGRFSVFNDTFIRIVKDSSDEVFKETGFYNLLYDGSSTLLKKEIKLVREEINTGEILRFIDRLVYYYIKKNNTWHTVKNKKAVMDIFKDRRKDIQQYIRKNKLKYRKDRDNMLVKVMAYYDQLIK